jgi:MYXO-CTERM domain-containing protein
MSRSRVPHRFADRLLRPICLGSVAAYLVAASPAAAVTTLNVDLSTVVRPATHAASGSLYGVTEKLPADVNALIAPLRPRMFTNPAANVQQPVGDAIVVAERVAPTGATVTIRLADWLGGFYTLVSMDDWFSKIDETVSRRKEAGLTNIYAYELWNEPNLTYSGSLAFNEFWKQTYTHLRELDPGEKITGPSLTYYDEGWLRDFLSFCKTNSCLPDIVGWHEMGGGNLTGSLEAYRSLEKQLGIGPLPISINEYSGAARIDVEGQPGASAPFIAKFERFGVDSACISFWDVAHPGRLGSLLATDSDPNGGWWFYRWYGDMSGNMVSTTPPTPSNITALDGFANLDTAGRSASVLFGGVNDGTIQVVVTGFSAAPFFGDIVHAVVEHTPFVSRTTVVRATEAVSTDDLAVANGQIQVTVTGANAKDGYRLVLTPVGGGSGGSGGAGGTGGASATGGNANTGGTAVTGGRGSTGGATATGGRSGRGGSGGSPATGGQPSTGGRFATGGVPATGGTATGGVATGGVPTGGTAVGGRSASGGASASGGNIASSAGGSGGTSSGATGGCADGSCVGEATGGSTNEPGPAGTQSDEGGGCACRAGRSGGSAGGGVLAGLVVLGLVVGRRRRTAEATAPASTQAVLPAKR